MSEAYYVVKHVACISLQEYDMHVVPHVWGMDLVITCRYYASCTKYIINRDMGCTELSSCLPHVEMHHIKYITLSLTLISHIHPLSTTGWRSLTITSFYNAKEDLFQT
jgi:hypothetical protein